MNPRTVFAIFMVLHQIAVQNLKRVVEAAKKVILVQDVNFASMMNALQYLKVSMEQLIQKLVKESGVVSTFEKLKIGSQICFNLIYVLL